MNGKIWTARWRGTPSVTSVLRFPMSLALLATGEKAPQESKNDMGDN
jgi:hypothetical protein